MIFYGTKGSHLKSEKINNAQCNHCQQQTPHNISVYGRYAHIYWIPFFPLSKKGVSECSSCKATFDKKNMSDSLKSKLDTILRNTKSPITYWSGLFIIVFLIGFGIYSVGQHSKDVAVYIENPEKGDIIDYKPSDFYSTLKVIEVTNDSVFVIPNKYEIEKRSRLYKIDKKVNYNLESVYGYSKKDYTSNFKNNTFLDVER